MKPVLVPGLSIQFVSSCHGFSLKDVCKSLSAIQHVQSLIDKLKCHEKLVSACWKSNATTIILNNGEFHKSSLIEENCPGFVYFHYTMNHLIFILIYGCELTFHMI